MIRIDVPESWRSTAAVVASVDETDLAESFTEAEHARIASFRREKRRREWAASRMAAKLLAVETGLCHSLTDCTVASAYRRPALTIHGEESAIGVSITHSDGAGAAAISPNRIGIDLQLVRPMKDRSTKFFLNDDELGIWRESNLADPLIHLWCAKEAGYKLHAMPGWYRGVKIELVEERPDGLLLKYADPLSRGSIETARLKDGFVFARARKTGTRG
jgi:phosphopantetheinyl transferase